MKKRMFAVLVLVGVTLLISSCRPTPAATPLPAPTATPLPPPTATPPPPPTETPAPVVLRVAFVGPVAESVGTAAIPAFEAENPNIKVEWERFEWGDYTTKLMATLAAGTAPDVFVSWFSDGATYGAEGIIRPLDDLLDKEDYVESIYNLCVWGGKLYCMPWAANAKALYYRKDLLEEAGLDPNKPPATWDELRDYAVALTKRDDQGNITRAGFTVFTNQTLFYNMSAQFNGFLEQAGGQMFNEDGTEVLFNSPAGVEALEFLAELVREDKVDVIGAEQDVVNDLPGGKTAMILTGDWAVRAFESLENVDVAMPPGNKRDFCELGGDALFMYAETKHPEEAAKFLKVLLNAENSIAYAKGKGKAIPCSAAAADSDYVKGDLFLLKIAGITAQCSAGPVHPQWREVEGILIGYMAEVFLGHQSAQEALDMAAEEANAVLAEQ